MRALAHLRVGEHLGEVVDRRRTAPWRPRARRASRRAGRSFRRAASSGTRTARWRTRPALRAKRASAASSAQPGDGAEAGELGVVADGEDHVAVGDLEDLVRDDALVRVAGALRRDAARQVAGAEVGEHRDLGVEQRHVDRLALAGAVAVAQRGEDRGHGVHAGEEIGDRDADLLRAAAGRVVGDLARDGPVTLIRPPMPWTA